LTGSQSLPSIAAVTINFGAPDDTLECVRSLLGTGYQPLRVIVVENGSPAKHRDRLKQQLPAGVELLESPTNEGFSGGNNMGIRRALQLGVDYVLLLNNDATVKPDALHRMAEAAGKLGRMGVLGGKILVADEDGPTQRLWSTGGWWSPLKASGYPRGCGEEDRGQYDTPSEEQFIAACLWLIPAAVLREVGLLGEEFFIYCEDLDFCLRLSRAGYRIFYDPGVVCYHKVSRTYWQNRDRASPGLNYYTNRNRIKIARRWLSPLQRVVFYPYLFASRLLLAVKRRDLSYLGGLWDGVRGATGPWPGLKKALGL
jgi:GT2 family glycosyltransferase